MRKAVEHLKTNDPVLRKIILGVGPYRADFLDPTFTTVVRCIVYQQLSGKVARVIYQRLELASGGIAPKRILALAESEMHACGLSGQKTAYIRDLAGKTSSGEVSFRKLPHMDDRGVIEHLTQVKGIGVWTAQMFLMFALQRPDVLPVGDLGLRTAVQKAYELDDLPKPGQIEQIATPWQPYRSVATWYLWRSLDNAAAL